MVAIMKRKLLISYIIIIIVCIFIGNFISFSLMQNNYLSTIEKRLIEEAEMISYIIKDQEDIDAFVKEQAHLEPRITVINQEGNVIADSKSNIKNMDNHNNREEVKAAKSTGFGKAIRYSDTLNKDMMYVALPMEDTNNIIRTALPYNNIKNEYKVIWIGSIIAIVLAILVSVFIAFFFSNNVSKPLMSVAEASQKIANGNYKYRISQALIQDKYEAGQVARSFNTMAEYLDQTISQLDDKTAKLTAMLTSMNNGVVAIDNNMRVTLINPSAEKLLNINENHIGQYFLGAVMNLKLEKMLQETINGRQTNQKELIWNNNERRVYRITASPLRNGNKYEGAIMLIEDITEIKQLENMRSDFVANVSHELKTPLTSIIGFVETLLSGQVEDEKVVKRFLTIISVEALRLKRLIEDILSLSALEKDNADIKDETINVVNAITEVIDLLEETAKEKQVTISVKIYNPTLLVKGDFDRTKQMVLNLMDNAIKYNQPGGSVDIEAQKMDDEVWITIKDTGIGIDEQHLERLFERFYRVDKGRSRETGGTGLGLAIVKHIVKKMNGCIEVESKKNEGTTFIIKLPYITKY